jgi:hypothetical protein
MDVRQPWFVAGFLIGAAGAATAVLLRTPMSGRELRREVRDYLAGAWEDARAAGREAEAEVLTRYRQVRGTPLDADLALPPGPPRSAAPATPPGPSSDGSAPRPQPAA